jgi:(p)ppGpp synthase/HD superfamily hydrolase
MEFAVHYHGIIDQRRKYTGEPYIEHPKAVAEIVRTVPYTPAKSAMLAAAWLHDVVEDTPATIDEVRGTFGAEIAGLVEMLTNVSRPEDGNRAKRKDIDRRHTALSSREAKTVKLADIIDNTRNIVARDQVFARTYLIEKARLLQVLRDGDAALWFQAEAMITEAMASLASANSASANSSGANSAVDTSASASMASASPPVDQR